MLKRIIAVLATATLAVGLALGAAMPASAHDANYAATCGSLDLNLVSYGGGNNYVTVTIDGAKVEDNLLFKNSHTKSYSWSTSSSHTYKIEIDAADAGYDKLGANAITGSFGPCTTTTSCINPLSQNQGFTILTEGNFTNTTSGAHVEGTVAAGGDLVISNRYTTQNNHDNTPIPVVDGKSTGLLVGGQATLNTDGQAFFVMSGVARIGNVPNTAAMTDGGKRFRPVSSTERYLEVTDSTTVDEIKAPGLWSSTFGSAFSTLRANSTTIAGYTSSNVQFVSLSNSPNGGKQVTLVAGVTNVLRVSGSTLGSAGQLWFAGGVVPSATTPFIIDVTDTGSYNVAAPVLRNIDEEYVLWNFSKATTLGLTTTEFIKGSILAPNADLTLNSGGIEGQIAAKSMTVKSVGEIHHIMYKPCVQATSVSGAATTAPASCDTTSYVIANGSVTAAVKTGVVYQLWNQAKSTKIADLTAGTAYPIAAGSYYVRVLPASNAYSVSSANEWISAVVAAYTGECKAPQDVSGAATTTAQTCDANYDLQNGSVTATAKTGVTYQLWNQAKDTKIADLTAGTAYPVANGTYFVKVLPASSSYTVAANNQWIQAVVGAYQGTCAESVSGAVTTTAEYCDANVYEVKNGSITATVKTGVLYELWNSTKTQKIADLTAGTPYPVANGTYYVFVKPASGKYTVSANNQWIEAVVGKYAGICAKDVSGEAKANAETCDANYDIKLGSVTATVKEGVTYQLFASDKTTKIADLTAGTAYPIGNGSYFVKVLPATDKYTVAANNQWISVVVGKYTGVCAQDTSGSVTPAAETCQTSDWTIQDGSITANAATGVKYELYKADKTTKIANLTIGQAYGLAHGSYWVKVVPATSKYVVSSANEWIPVTITEFTGVCAEEVSGSAAPTAEVCQTPDYLIAQGSILADKVTGVTYVLYAADKTTKIADLVAGTPYKVDAGTYFVHVEAASAKYHVSSANEWIEQIVGKYTGTCAQDVKGSATGVGETCDVNGSTYTVGKGSVTAGKAEGVVYQLFASDKTTKIADLTAEQAYAVAGGTYYVKVLPASSKYDVTPANQWIEVVVPTNTTVCEVIGDPTKFEGCVVNPNDLDDSNWTAYLTIVAVNHVNYRVYISDGTTWVDKGIWAAGKYNAGTPALPLGSLVKVVAQPETGWSLLAPKDWTFQFSKGFDCDLSTNGVVEPNVVFAQSCAAGPTYKLTIDGGVAGSVLWSVNGGPTTTQLGTFSVAPGTTVKIVATPAPGAGFTGAGQTALQRTFEKTFTSGAECDLETLAFTGQDVTPYLVIAVILFQAGLALVAVQFIRARRKARHLAN